MQPCLNQQNDQIDHLQKQKSATYDFVVVVSEHPCSVITLSYKFLFVNPFFEIF